MGLSNAPREDELQKSGVGPNAFYAPRKRAVFFVDNDAIPYDGELAVLILGHEYIHSIQDREGVLLRSSQSHASHTFEQALTFWSVLEGEAALFEEILRALIHKREPSTWVPGRFEVRTAGTDEAILRQRRPVEASFATFPYTYGAYWATANWLAHRPPLSREPAWVGLSTREFLGRRHGFTSVPATGEAQCLEDDVSEHATGQRDEGREALGAWLVQTIVRSQTSDAARARRAAEQWRGDWISISSNQLNSDVSFIWQSCWGSANAAIELRQLIDDQLRRTSSGRSTVTRRATRVTAVVR